VGGHGCCDMDRAHSSLADMMTEALVV